MKRHLKIISAISFLFFYVLFVDASSGISPVNEAFEKSDLIVEGYFKNIENPRKIATFIILNILKGKSTRREIHIVSKYDQYGRDPRANENYLLCLLDRKHIPVETRKKHDSKCHIKTDFYKTVYNQLHLDRDSLESERIEAFKWYSKIFEKLKTINSQEIISVGMKSRNKFIKQESTLNFFNYEIKRIESLGNKDSVLNEYYKKLKIYNNYFFASRAISYLNKHKFEKALPVILKKIKNDYEYDWFYYLEFLEGWDDETVTKYCIKKINILDKSFLKSGEIKWLVDFLSKRNYIGKDQDLEQLSHRLSPTIEKIFLENSSPFPNDFRYNSNELLYVYMLSNKEWSANLLRDIYSKPNVKYSLGLKETIIHILTKREDIFAKNILDGFFDPKKANYNELDCKLLGSLAKKVGGDSITTIIIDAFKKNKIPNHWCGLTSSFRMLHTALKKSSPRIRNKTINYIFDMYKMSDEVGIKVSIIDEMSEHFNPSFFKFLVSEFELVKDDNIKLRIINSFNDNNQNTSIPFLEKIVQDATEHNQVRIMALRTLISLDYENHVHYLAEIIDTKLNSFIQHRAISLIIENNHPQKMDLVKLYLQKNGLYRNGITGYFKYKNFNSIELNEISDLLFDLYDKVEGGSQAKLDLIKYLNYNNEINVQRLLLAMTNDEDRYVREEASYTLIKRNHNSHFEN